MAATDDSGGRKPLGGGPSRGSDAKPVRHPRLDESHVVGWCEYVDLPDWGITGLRAKTDSGARSSSLHVENLEFLDENRVSFEVILHRRRRDRRVRIEADLVRRGKVRVANGQVAIRPYVRTTLRLGPIERVIELNLVDRTAMIHRMLLGRSALEGVVVDVTRRYALGPRPVRKKKPPATPAPKRDRKPRKSA